MLDTQDIDDVVRVGIVVVHEKTGRHIRFPLIHVLIEKSVDGYAATCMEYAQTYEDPGKEDAVTGLVFVMLDYFVTVIKKEGCEFLYRQCQSADYEVLWGAVREFEARKHDSDLKFFETLLREPLYVQNSLSKHNSDSIQTKTCRF